MAYKSPFRVLETTTSTGTGNITGSGAAVTGMRTFSAAGVANGDTFAYMIQAVDGSGNLTGDWEIGLGTMGASNVITRTTVVESSNSNAAVSFSAGTKHIGIIKSPKVAGYVPKATPTVGASPYTYTNSSDGTQQVFLTNVPGLLSNFQYVRGGNSQTTYSTAAYYMTLAPGDGFTWSYTSSAISIVVYQLD